MCGIAGIVNWTSKPVESELLKYLTRKLTHRGPDGEGYHIYNNVGLGHRRLSIIDIDAGKQPMSNENDRYWVTYNGEVYNFRSLKTDLQSKGHIFKTDCDTEVLVHGYEEWGIGLLSKLRGMFAFAILDQAHNELFLARDRLGIKPLVYYAGKEKLIFASEIKAIIADPEYKKEINHKAVGDYFQYGYIPAPHTAFKSIFKLLPGHYLKLKTTERSELKQECYWSINYTDNDSISEAEASELVDEVLNEAVSMRMISDVPLGGLLSGGLDSSAVVSYMANNSTDPISSFSIGFDEEKFSEAKYALKVSEHIGTKHYEHTVNSDIRDLLPKLVYHFDEPFSDASAVPTYHVCKMARNNVTVCLSGDGGDEVFGGYDRYLSCLSKGRFDFLPSKIRKTIFGSIGMLKRAGLPGAGFFKLAALEPEERFIQLIKSQYGSIEFDEYFSASELLKIKENKNDFDLMMRVFQEGTSDRGLNQYLNADTQTYLPYDILTKVDITSMMNSLEVRVPLLDHKLVELMATMPQNLKIKNKETKYLLKQIMRPRLPNGIIDRPKMGFGVPMREWIANDLQDMVHSYLLDPSRTSGLLNTDLLQTMIKDNEKNLYKSKISGKLWWVLFFEMWYQDVYSG